MEVTLVSLTVWLIAMLLAGVAIGVVLGSRRRQDAAIVPPPIAPIAVAPPAPVVAPPAPRMLLVRFLEADGQVAGERQIEARQRRLKLPCDGGVFQAEGQQPDGTWHYRRSH
jgi:hypothetical protein